MDQVIAAARALGHAIQADERYIRYNTAQERNDEDTELQALISAFSEKRDELQEEAQKGEQNTERVNALNAEVKEMYATIFQNETMQAFTSARDELQEMLGFVNQIITGTTNGADPDTIQYEASCGGSCGGCSGCH